MLKVHKEKEEANLYPELRLVEEYEATKIQAVDKNGEWLADLITFENEGIVRANRDAYDLIKSEGYRTDFARWDGEERIKIEE